MREIVLDIETTGLDPASDRIVEIGCLELRHHLPTGRRFRRYVNPERDMPAGAEEVHGLTTAFLADKPVFAAVADDLLDFLGDLGDAKLVIHNVSFDLRFLNAELARLDRPPLVEEHAVEERTVDTVQLARRKYPGAPAALDALCRRFGIDVERRGKHGALIDAELLAEVYLELVGGRQPGFDLAGREALDARPAHRPLRPARSHAPSPEELEAHEAFVAGLKDPIWKR